MTRDDRKVHAVLLRGGDKPIYPKVRAVDGVLGPGKRIEIEIEVDGVVRRGMVVEGWPHAFGSVVCVDLDDERRG